MGWRGEMGEERYRGAGRRERQPSTPVASHRHQHTLHQQLQAGVEEAGEEEVG